jgi:hypothetical protein
VLGAECGAACWVRGAGCQVPILTKNETTETHKGCD